MVAMSPSLLTRLGLVETAANVLSHLVEEGPCTMRELATATGLSESQVASGLRQCQFRGWVAADLEQVRSRGRPSREWSLAISAFELLNELEVEVQSAHVELSEAIRAVNAAFS